MVSLKRDKDKCIIDKHIECAMCRKEKPTMADLKWAVAYRFDDETDSYVPTTFDQETAQEWGQFGEQQVMPPVKDRFSDSDLDDSDEDLS